MKKAFLIYLALALIGILLAGCSDRENPADFPKINERGFKNDGVFSYPRAYSSIESHASWEFFHFTEDKNFYTKIYTPPSFRIQGDPFPILYLLHDFDGEENYYFARMIHRIADSLIYEGEIKEFYIATVDVSTPYGGSWVVNNEFFGWFEEMVGEEWIGFIESELNPYLKVISKRDSRAIGGVGMGGYAAIKLAAKYPDLYSSVSASNPAGKFDGNGGTLHGVNALISKLFAEQGFTIPEDPDDFLEFDTLDMHENKPYTLLFMSMAQAFSPHPSAGEEGYTDSTTYLPFYGVDLPFDYNGNLYQPIWDKWLANDLDELLVASANHFDSIALYIEYSDTNQFLFNEQAQAIMDICDQLGIEYTSDNYSGYEGNPVLNQNFVYDRLVKILKFHSRHLDDEL